MDEYKFLKDSIAMTIGSTILILMLFWGFPVLGTNALYETNVPVALMLILIIAILLAFGTVLFLGALSNLGRNYAIVGLLGMCFGTVILLIILFGGILFLDIDNQLLEKIETLVMTSLGLIIFFRGGFYLSKYNQLAGTIAEIIGFLIVMGALSLWIYAISELWKALILTFAGFCLILRGFHSFGAYRSLIRSEVTEDK